MSEYTDVSEIHLQIEAAKKVVEVSESLNRLKENKDFKQVVSEGYFDIELKRLAKLSSAVSESNLPALTRDIYAIGAFDYYLATVEQSGEKAKERIAEFQEMLANPEEFNIESVGE